MKKYLKTMKKIEDFMKDGVFPGFSLAFIEEGEVTKYFEGTLTNNEHSKLVESDFVKEVWIDVAMPFGYISEDLVAQLAQLAPFGQGNESPTFAQKDVEILNARVLGKDHNVVRLSLKDSAGTRMEGLVFTDGDAFIEEAKRFIDIIYAPQVNEYMGQRTLQVVIRDWKFKSK